MSEFSSMMNDPYRRESARQHVRHVWMNRWSDDERSRGAEHRGDLYEFMRMLSEIKRLPDWFRKARSGQLPTIHQQCSRVAPEPIVGNRLICAMGVDVRSCPILTSLAAVWTDMAGRNTYYAGLSDDDLNQTMAEVCAWHIFTAQVRGSRIDTSEGYVQDESDRMFWRRVYDSLAGEDEL